MGKVLSSMKHPLRNFNLENRVEKVISQPKPKPAPKHEREKVIMDKLMKDEKEAFETSLKKDADLDKRLKNVFVTSQNALEQKPPPNPNRPLPTDKKTPEPYLFGFKEPNHIPFGKTTLRTALQFITNHQSEPEKYTCEQIAEEHKLSEDVVRSILKYYQVFEVYLPKERLTKAHFAGPSLPKVVVIKDIRKQLPEPQGDSKTNET